MSVCVRVCVYVCVCVFVFVCVCVCVRVEHGKEQNNLHEHCPAHENNQYLIFSALHKLLIVKMDSGVEEI